jgi:NAD(P)H-dependent FMN reductase
MSPRILAFAGSLRRESFNKKLVSIAVNGATIAGAEVTLIDLKDFPLPVFDQDLEADQGMPENGKKLKQLFVLPDQVAVAKAREAIKPDGSLVDPNQQAGIEGLGKTLAAFLMKLKA